MFTPISSFSSERNLVNSLRLIRGDGPLKECLACFQMLAQLMKLPFRRDAIEEFFKTTSTAVSTPIFSSVVN